jgi:TPR repeat protein
VQYNLGVCYEQGWGVPRDYVEAARLYQLAAAQGNAEAQCGFGGLYENGKGVAQDFVEAARLIGLSAAPAAWAAVRRASSSRRALSASDALRPSMSSSE